jgi:GNAT superfamily N-acetyltransferase
MPEAVVFKPMSEVPASWKPRLRELSYGPYDGTMVRWTYHDGSTWTAILFEKDELEPQNIVGWAVFTLQEEPHPVIGVFTDPGYRGCGYASQLVEYLLEECAQYVPHERIYAVSANFAEYGELIEAAGFEHLEWE